MPTDEKKATITRYRVYKTFMTPGYAWRWLYDATGPDGEVIVRGADRLSIAVTMARKLGYVPTRTWFNGTDVA